MDFFVANFSEEADDTVNQWLINYRDYLAENDIILDMNVQFCSDEVKNEILKINQQVSHGSYLCKDLESITEKYYCGMAEGTFAPNYRKHILEKSNAVDYRLIVLGEAMHLLNPWGDAIGFCTVILFANEKVVWHEVSHLLDAKDHYAYTEHHEQLEVCEDENCLMQYKLGGELCQQSLREIESFLINKSDGTR